MIKELLFFLCGQAFGLLLIKLSTLIKDHKKKELQTNKKNILSLRTILC